MLRDKSITDPDFLTTTSAGCYPLGTAGTGTVSSTGIHIAGSSTTFLTSYNVGEYIYVKDQVRKIIAIQSETKMTVNRAFAIDLVAEAFKVVLTLPVYNIGIFNVSGGTATIGTINYDAQALAAGLGMNFNSNNSLSPICWIPNSATIMVNNGEFVK